MLTSTTEEGLEIEDDSISQASVDGSQRKNQHTRTKRVPLCAIEVRRKKSPGLDFKLSQFKLPKPVNQATTRSVRLLGTTSCSDGFEGDENLPTGRTMRMSGGRKRQATIPKIILRLGALTLGPEKVYEDQFEEEVADARQSRPKSRPKRKLHGKQPITVYIKLICYAKRLANTED